MESSTWQVILAIAAAAVLQSIAYAIREWANGIARQRMENKIDSGVAMGATSLVSSGRLPQAAPCIPAVAAALSNKPDSKDVKSAEEYVKLAICVAHDVMTREGIPAQSQDLLIEKLKKMIEETQAKEQRHTENNTAWIKTLREEIDRLKVGMPNTKESS